MLFFLTKKKDTLMVLQLCTLHCQIYRTSCSICCTFMSFGCSCRQSYSVYCCCCCCCCCGGTPVTLYDSPCTIWILLMWTGNTVIKYELTSSAMRKYSKTSHRLIEILSIRLLHYMFYLPLWLSPALITCWCSCLEVLHYNWQDDNKHA